MENISKLSDLRWDAPIVPSVSLAGIEIGLTMDEFINKLSHFKVRDSGNFYQFEKSPALRLERYSEHLGHVFIFSLADKELTNWSLYVDSPSHAAVEDRALAVQFRNEKVHSIKVWQFEFVKPGEKPKNCYAGKLPEGIGLGDPLVNILAHTRLTYDEAEEWFYTDENYGGLEITGCGEPEDHPEQIITAIAVIGGESTP